MALILGYHPLEQLDPLLDLIPERHEFPTTSVLNWTCLAIERLLLLCVHSPLERVLQE